jgi:hypothetical protein
LELGDTIAAEIIGRREDGDVELRFLPGGVPLERQIATEGKLPLPPSRVQTHPGYFRSWAGKVILIDESFGDTIPMARVVR